MPSAPPLAPNLAQIDQVIAAGPFAPTWDSLAAYTAPTWYQDAKFGIFIHWGVYSVPAFGNEWYARNMYLPDQPEYAYHVTTYGPQRDFGYKDFIPQFTGAAFDPAAWANLFRQAGARFVMPVAEHHDGFPLYACSYTDWSAVKLGPRRDLIGELAEAVRAAEMTFAVSYHRAENWWFYDGGMAFPPDAPADVQDERYAGFYGRRQPKATQPDAAFLDEWLLRVCELVERYRPQVVWFDWWIEEPAFAPYLQRFAAYYYNRGAAWGRGVAINYKHAAFPPGTAVWDIERGQSAALRHDFWQTDTAVAKNSWGYTTAQDYKRAGDLVGDLVDIVSKRGALLLNIGPRADGSIPAGDVEILLEIGAWLATNGEAIYGSRPWKIFGEGPTQIVEGSFQDSDRPPFTGDDIRYTTQGETLYAILLGLPGKTATLPALGHAAGLYERPIGQVTLVGQGAPLVWAQAEEGLRVELPAQLPCDHAYVLKITPA
jgi:alpha-L-fucosidase